MKLVEIVFLNLSPIKNRGTYMWKILIITFLMILSIVVRIVPTFAQEGEVKVLVRQVGDSTYFYKVTNPVNKSIVKIIVGRNYNIKDSENELLIAPVTIGSPSGWEGYHVFREESLYLHIRWNILDYAFVITPRSYLEGFIVQMPQSYDLMKQASFSIIFDDGTVTAGKVAIDNDNDGYPVDVDCNDNDPLEHPSQTWYKDADGDGYSDGSVTITCARPTNYKAASELTAPSGDCNDSNAAVNPGAAEILGNGIDDDCNPATPDFTPADLIISTLSVPATAGAGQIISITDTTKNNGTADAGASTTKFYLSTNTTYDAGDVYLGNRALPSLIAGTSNLGSTPVTLPASTSTGAYYIIARADADGVIAEKNETNNNRSSSINIGPDLSITSLSVPATASAGQVISITDTTKNSGGSLTGTSNTKFYWSTNSTYDAADVYLGSRAIPSLAAGATSSGSTSVTIPATTAVGSYYFIARADADGVIVETNENNNTMSRLIKIGPDLNISAFSAPTTGVAGQTISISDTTKNSGGGSAGASTTKFYLSTNATYDIADIYLGNRVVPSLIAGASSAGSTPVTIPAATAVGSYYLIARADADGAIAETSESNNNRVKSISITQ